MEVKNKLNISALKDWFVRTKRDLPWRRTRDPYAIWISEVMLQQTQVSVVIPYFLSWMEAFPTVRHLAAASLDQVIKRWEGLGYYSRARNLYEGAHYLVKSCQGNIPENEEGLQKIKGLGPYTIGAILSFAFHQKKAAVDGNTLRVLARYFGFEQNIAKASSQKLIRAFLENQLPDEEPWIINEALIELGATVCQKKARCTDCPLKAECYSFLHNKQDCLPIKSKQAPIQQLYRTVCLIQYENSFLVKKVKKGLMADLYEFPYFEKRWNQEDSEKEIQDLIQNIYQLPVKFKKRLSGVSHGFTRYQAHLSPFLFNCEEIKPLKHYEWKSFQELHFLAFSSGHRRILQELTLEF